MHLTILLGKCMYQAHKENPDINAMIAVKGCPPNNALVVKAIIGDRAEVKRMYAEENLDKTD